MISTSWHVFDSFHFKKQVQGSSRPRALVPSRDHVMQAIRCFFALFTTHPRLVQLRMRNALHRFKRVRAFLKKQIEARKRVISRAIKSLKLSYLSHMSLPYMYRRKVITEAYERAFDEWRASQRPLVKLLLVAEHRYKSLCGPRKVSLWSPYNVRDVLLPDTRTPLQCVFCMKACILLLQVFVVILDSTVGGLFLQRGPALARQARSLFGLHVSPPPPPAPPLPELG